MATKVFIKNATDTITDVKSANALLNFEVARNPIVYGDYILANAVTLDTVKDHVKALTAIVYPGKLAEMDDATKMERKYLSNRIRNGLNHHLNKPKSKSTPSPWFLTDDGLQALAGMTDAEILDIVKSEIVARAK